SFQQTLVEYDVRVHRELPSPLALRARRAAYTKRSSFCQLSAARRAVVSSPSEEHDYSCERFRETQTASARPRRRRRGERRRRPTHLRGLPARNRLHVSRLLS